MKIYKKLDQKWIEEVHAGAVFLHPADTSWAISSSAFSQKGYLKLQSLTKSYSSERTTLLVDSIHRLKKYVYQLHPRIETLLSYHHRSLTLLFKDIKMLPTHLLDQNGCAAISLIHDKKIKNLINSLNQPLISKPLQIAANSYATSLDHVQVQVKEDSDFIYHPSGPIFNQPDIGKPSVMASVNKDGELFFQNLTRGEIRP